MKKKIHWRLMTWMEIREAQKSDPVVIIPAGTIETQGPYTYIGLECVLPERLAETVSRRTNAIVAPTIPFGYSALFQDYPGTITLRTETLMGLYEDVVRSIARHGFKHLLFLAMHVPNQPIMQQVAHKIRDELGLLIAWINPGRLAPAIMKQISPNYEAARGHGADPGLSQAMYLEPDMVDTARVVPNQFITEYKGLKIDGTTPMFNGYPFDMAMRLQDVSAISGGYGDPSYASKEQGEKIFEKMVEHLTAVVEKFVAMETKV